MSGTYVSPAPKKIVFCMPVLKVITISGLKLISAEKKRMREGEKIQPSPEEDRTPDLRISWHGTAYKYDALTDCATGEHTSTTFSIIILYHYTAYKCDKLSAGEHTSTSSFLIHSCD